MLILILIAIIILCLVVWAIQTYLPFDPNLKNILCFVCVLIAIIYILNAAGIAHL